MVRNMHVYGKFSDIISDIKIYVKKGTRVHELMKLGSPAHETGFVSPRTYVLQKLLFLVVLMTLGISSAWGQVGTDYSGIYYIASYARVPNSNPSQYYYDPTDPTNTDNYYLCPSDGWIYYKKTNNWTADKASSDGPFLTTFKCRTNDYDAQGGMSNAKWVVTKHGDYYTFYHTGTSKYLVLSSQISGCGADRMRVHLETIASPETNDNALFTIAPQHQGLYIAPKKIPGDRITVNGGNKDALTGQSGKTGGPKGSGYNYENTAGIVGIYRGNEQVGSDDNRYFYLEDVITRPTIAFNSSDLIEITAAQEESVTIRYTTDGTTPSRTNGTVYSGAFDPADNVTIIRAIAYGDDWESNIATFAPTVLCGTTHKRLIQSQNNNWTTGDHQGFHFYMVPGDEDKNKVLRVNTTSLFRSSMEWYFKSAGVEDGVQYYYIVNNANGKYLRCDAKSNVYLDTYSNANDSKFKFKIVESPTTGTYNIYPYGLNILINKNTDNANNGVINTSDYSVANSNSANTRWKFVTKSALDQTVPFTVSDGSSRTHYQLRSSGDEYYVKAPAEANAFATMVEAASADEDTYWYLKLAATATDADWLTYYYICNAQTGEYLYYTGNSTSDGKVAFKTSATLGTGDALQRYYFTWARSTTDDYYFIVPKMLRDQTLNNFSTMDRFNTTQLRVAKVRATGTSAWSFVYAPFCLDPVITQATDGTRTVTITCPTPGVDIYYRLDGEDPEVPAAGNDPVAPTFKYTAPFVPDASANQIKVKAANTTDRTAASAVVSFTLPKYTYYIVNRSNELAVSKADVRQAAGTSLSGYASIPTEIQSSYISDETITFYTMTGDFDAANLDGEHSITKTPATSANIYITYTTTKLGSKFLSLTNSAPFNIKG